MMAMLSGGGGKKSKKSAGKKKNNKKTTETKNENKNKNNNDDEPKAEKRERSTSKSSSKGVTDKPLINSDEMNDDKDSETPTDSSSSSSTTTKSTYKPPMGAGGGMGGMIMNAAMLNRTNLKSGGKGKGKVKGKGKGSNEEEEKILEIVSKKHGKRHIRLFVPLDQYIVYKKGDNGKGLQIDSFCDNKYGKMMEEKGLKIGWKLTKIAKQDATKMSLFVIKNQLTNQAQTSGKNGYNITFEGEYEKKGTPQPQPKSTPLKPITNKNQSTIPSIQQAIPNKAETPDPVDLDESYVLFLFYYFIAILR